MPTKDYFTVTDDTKALRYDYDNMDVEYGPATMDLLTAEEMLQYMRLAESNGWIKPSKWKRIAHCKAWIYSGYSEITAKLYFLKSYNTVVAVYLEGVNNVYVWRRYSRTTSMHVTRFKQWLVSEGIADQNIKTVNLEHIH